MAEFDVVVYGATGFAGRLAAKYLTRRMSAEPLRIAIAGRNQEKLDDLAASCELKPEVIVADSSDQTAIAALVARTRVVLNFAGPFSLHAEPLIAACAKAGCHYLDITGETPFVREMIGRYQEAAQASHARLIPCSGFDSVPADLVCDAALRAGKEYGFDLDQISTYYEARGGVNGGTVASLLHIAEDTSLQAMFDPKMMVLDPAWPSPPRQALAPHYEEELQRWSAPFVMAPINQAVVHRSAYLREADAAPEMPFVYEERVLVGRAFGAAQATVATGMLAGFGMAARSHVGRQLITAVAPKPGEGPSQQVQEQGFFRTQLIGRAAGEVKVRVTMERDGDPGNQITVMLASESAMLAAAAEFATERAGFLTPATAFGERLVDKLQGAGFKFTTSVLDKGDHI